jgi:hypothetical protein
MREIPVRKVEEAAKIKKQIKTQIKDMGLTRRTSFMKKERLDCPMLKEEITPLTCMVCPYYRRRVMGFVHCAFPEEDSEEQ